MGSGVERPTEVCVKARGGLLFVLRWRVRVFGGFGRTVALKQLVQVSLQVVGSQAVRGVLQPFQVCLFGLAVLHYRSFLGARLMHAGPFQSRPWLTGDPMRVKGLRLVFPSVHLALPWF